MELRLVKCNGDFQIATNVSKLMAIWKSPFHFNACIETLFNNCFYIDPKYVPAKPDMLSEANMSSFSSA
jgi:hypothetical protein